MDILATVRALLAAAEARDPIALFHAATALAEIVGPQAAADLALKIIAEINEPPAPPRLPVVRCAAA